MGRTTTICLFGGALFGAGLAHTAAAQEFEFLSYNGGASNTSYLIAYGTDLPGIGSYDLVIAPNGDPGSATDSISANYNGFGGAMSISYTSILCEAYASSAYGPGYGFAGGYAYFTVTAAADLMVAWNFTSERPGSLFADSSLVLVDRTGSPNTLLSVSSSNGAPSSGTATIPLTPGNRYLYALTNLAYESNGSTSATAELLASCFADCDANGAFNVDDIECFVSAFLDGFVSEADCTGNGVLNVDDIECFVDAFLSQCVI
ncbi:MAG: hypothetical protein DHS20C14_17820 [Phycisphaeraceae bacterium]|nr:MAG: hypothetical protein DHS20C14_17820 [Phycisphaeraceae bacterium]